MGEVVPLRFRLGIGKVGFRLGHVERLLAEDQRESIARTDPELFGWLEANTPGWDVEHEPCGYSQRDLPIGEDHQATFIDHLRYLTFRSRDHKEACERRIRAETERIAERRARRSALMPGIEERCTGCCGPMEPATSRIDLRGGPILFVSDLPALACEECGEEQIMLRDYGFSDVASDEIRRWLSDDARRAAQQGKPFAELRVSHDVDADAMAALVAPVMGRWIEETGASVLPGAPLPEGRPEGDVRCR